MKRKQTQDELNFEDSGESQILVRTDLDSQAVPRAHTDIEREKDQLEELIRVVGEGLSLAGKPTDNKTKWEASLRHIFNENVLQQLDKYVHTVIGESSGSMNEELKFSEIPYSTHLRRKYGKDEGTLKIAEAILRNKTLADVDRVRTMSDEDEIGWSLLQEFYTNHDVKRQLDLREYHPKTKNNNPIDQPYISRLFNRVEPLFEKALIRDMLGDQFSSQVSIVSGRSDLTYLIETDCLLIECHVQLVKGGRRTITKNLGKSLEDAKKFEKRVSEGIGSLHRTITPQKTAADAICETKLSLIGFLVTKEPESLGLTGKVRFLDPSLVTEESGGVDSWLESKENPFSLLKENSLTTEEDIKRAFIKCAQQNQGGDSS